MTDDRLELRCADADRDKVAGRLREHYAQGRLTLQEFDERTSAVYAAKTFGDLAPLTADLPAEAATDAPAAPTPGDEAARARKRVLALWAPWLMVNAICVLVWLLTSPGGYFWPAWVMGPWGWFILMATPSAARKRPRGAQGGGDRHDSRPDHPQDRRLDRRRLRLEDRRMRLEHRRQHRGRHDRW